MCLLMELVFLMQIEQPPPPPLLIHQTHEDDEQEKRWPHSLYLYIHTYNEYLHMVLLDKQLLNCTIPQLVKTLGIH